MKMNTRNMICGGFFIALAVILPVLFHFIGAAGQIFLPMHIPVLMAGLMAGGRTGFLTGALAPIMSSLLTGMPPLSPVLPVMVVELAVYGAVAGYLHRNRCKTNWVALCGALAAGRMAAMAAVYILAGCLNLPITPAAYVLGALITGLPGIIIQIIFLPLLTTRLEKMTLWRKGTVACEYGTK